MPGMRMCALPAPARRALMVAAVTIAAHLGLCPPGGT